MVFYFCYELLLHCLLKILYFFVLAPVPRAGSRKRALLRCDVDVIHCREIGEDNVAACAARLQHGAADRSAPALGLRFSPETTLAGMSALVAGTGNLQNTACSAAAALVSCSRKGEDYLQFAAIGK